MNDKEEALIREVLLLAAPYSPLRHDSSKWRCEALACGQVCDRVRTQDSAIVTLFITRPGDPAFLVSRGGQDEEFYRLADIAERLAVKRSADVFQSLYTVWRYVNPTRKKTISKEVYLKLTEIAATSLGLHFSSHYALHDMRLDFRSRSTLLFRDFYDSFFQLLDNSSPAKAPSEYVKQVAAVCNGLLNSKWYKQRAPASGSSSIDTRRAFDAWMLPFFHSPASGMKAAQSFPVSPSKPKPAKTRPQARHSSLESSLRVEASPEPRETRPVSRVNIEVKIQPQKNAKVAVGAKPRPATSKFTHRARAKGESVNYSIDLISVVSRSPSPPRHNILS